MHFLFFFSFLLCVLTGPLWSAQEVETPDPELLSLFPLGGQRGTAVEAQIRGRQLGGSYAVWPQSDGLTARIKKVEEVEEGSAEDEKEEDPSGDETEEKLPVYRVVVRIDIDHTARIGTHPIRLVSPKGLSNAVWFRVVDEPVIVEGEASHQTAQQAQPIGYPATLFGRITKAGEADYYSFDAAEGQEIAFEVVMTEGCDKADRFPEGAAIYPRLSLYRGNGSWLDPHRPTRVLFQEERSSDMVPVRSRLTYRVLQGGRYALEVSSLFGTGSPDCSYQLRMAPSAEPSGLRQEPQIPPGEWRARSFRRKLENDWIATLRSRMVETEGSSATGTQGASTRARGAVSDEAVEVVEGVEAAASPSLVRERDPNNNPEEALQISLPSILEGTIEQPGDIDSFRFQVKAGQRLAFEIETPEAEPPHFHPRLGIVDTEDQELFTNVHKKISLFNNNAERQVYFQSVEPKVIYTFDAGGEYVLQVRDITSRYGDPSYSYRILVRSQIQHVGEVLLGELEPANRITGKVTVLDRINLVPGQAKKLTIFTSHEEGFTGDVSFSMTGLPPGVEAFPAAEVNDTTAPTDVTVKPEIVLPKRQETTVVLLPEGDAPLTRTPVVVRLHCRPILKGKPGSTLLVREIPLMVVKGMEPDG